ncbi:MAG TPA: hypothetical protein VEF89_23385 [Solirubrobacteraceae bacterium]|nr:hypothetical protein [Solirubrobacteraceae bacterium]
MVIAGVVSLIAFAVVVASLAWLHVQPTGLSAARNAVSEYGITPFRSGYRNAYDRVRYRRRRARNRH